MLKRKSYKKWTLCFLSIFVIVTASVITLNYAVDPMWCFNHETPYAEWREFIDDRQQKTNLLRFRKNKIDTVCMGSSRVMQMAPDKMGDNAFNFALSSCMPAEYATLMEIFHRTRGYYPKEIIIGIDFFRTNAISATREPENRALPALASLDKNSFVYRMEMLSSIELARKSFNFIRKNMSIQIDGIENGDVKYLAGNMRANSYYPPISDMKRKRRACRGLYREFKNTHQYYQYNRLYKEQIVNFFKPLNDSLVIPFITPEGTMTLRLFAETPGRLDDYERMIRETVEVFGGVWNFMYVNSVTSDHSYWREPSHSLGQVNDWVLERIYGTGNPPADFGVYVTKDNIDEHIKEVKAQLLALQHQKDSWYVMMED